MLSVDLMTILLLFSTLFYVTTLLYVISMVLRPLFKLTTVGLVDLARQSISAQRIRADIPSKTCVDVVAREIDQAEGRRTR